MKKCLNITFEIQGSVKADKNVIVVPEVGGLISEISVREGRPNFKGKYYC